MELIMTSIADVITEYQEKQQAITAYKRAVFEVMCQTWIGIERFQELLPGDIEAAAEVFSVPVQFAGYYGFINANIVTGGELIFSNGATQKALKLELANSVPVPISRDSLAEFLLSVQNW
jgi:hypothetical protein